ncbi:hypothetical protein MVEN_00156800 [Mycena venus]|uniref:Uncharacterized protein n=1 Tax=Mycena venus TaxID=2733690 RepID=A0A8H7DCY7_9AGAR|nr:hypothetical protein MVEN_00156800 [Mycena venus]
MHRVNLASSPSNSSAHPLLGGKADFQETSMEFPKASPPSSREAPKRTRFQSSKGLRFLSFTLHSLLVVMHVALFAIWSRGIEHRVVFSLDRQKTVSFAITAITTGFGTIYLVMLVFLMQTFFTRWIIQTDQTLTAIHDSTAAWSGIGSAVFHLWHQTVSLPTWNSDWGDDHDVGGCAAGSLYSLPSIVEGDTSLGLYRGTLYDVLDINSGVSNADVGATGFNISCGYPANANISYEPYDGYYQLWVQDIPAFLYFQPALIFATDQTGDTFKLRKEVAGTSMQYTFSGIPAPDPLILLSTIPIIDASGHHLPMVNTSLNTITKHLPDQWQRNLPTFPVQILQCSQTLVSQRAVVDAQSREILSVEPDIRKTTSAWIPFDDYVNKTSGNGYIDGWAQCLTNPYARIGALDFTYLPNMTLHDLENALSILVASMFCTLGHVRPTTGYLDVSNTDPFSLIENPIFSPQLLRGIGRVTEISTLGRLDVVGGLAASVILGLLAVPSLFPVKGVRDKEIPIEGTGILHAIRLYRNNPGLDTLLPQVEHPTTHSLREAGMVRTKLI